MKRIAFALLLLLAPGGAAAQIEGRPTPGGCISVAGVHARVAASGRPKLRSFPGPPNYESVAGGDSEERVFILELPGPVCIDDGGDFADPSERFRTVHVAGDDEQARAALRGAIGRRVTVSGDGFASFTGHHHAPLVILADRVVVH